MLAFIARLSFLLTYYTSHRTISLTDQARGKYIISHDVLRLCG